MMLHSHMLYRLGKGPRHPGNKESMKVKDGRGAVVIPVRFSSAKWCALKHCICNQVQKNFVGLLHAKQCSKSTSYRRPFPGISMYMNFIILPFTVKLLQHMIRTDCITCDIVYAHKKVQIFLIWTHHSPIKREHCIHQQQPRSGEDLKHDLEEQKQILQSAPETCQPTGITKLKFTSIIMKYLKDISNRKMEVHYYKKRCLVCVAKSLDNCSNDYGFYDDHQNHSCQQNIHMIPEEMDMNQHPNAGKKKSSKEVANGFNLQKEEFKNKKTYYKLLYLTKAKFLQLSLQFNI